MDRYWLLTWTTYGTWLPGDERGFVGAVRQNSDGTQATHNQPGTEYDRERPHLEGFAKATQKLPTSRLTREQAAAVCKQIQATAAIRQWKLFAIAVMANHVQKAAHQGRHQPPVRGGATHTANCHTVVPAALDQRPNAYAWESSAVSIFARNRRATSSQNRQKEPPSRPDL